MRLNLQDMISRRGGTIAPLDSLEYDYMAKFEPLGVFYITRSSCNNYKLESYPLVAWKSLTFKSLKQFDAFLTMLETARVSEYERGYNDGKLKALCDMPDECRAAIACNACPVGRKGV